MMETRGRKEEGKEGRERGRRMGGRKGEEESRDKEKAINQSSRCSTLPEQVVKSILTLLCTTRALCVTKLFI